MHEKVCDALTSSFQIWGHMIRYAVIARVCAIMTSEDSCFNLTGNLTAYYIPCHIMTSYFTSFCKHCQLYCGSYHQQY